MAHTALVYVMKLQAGNSDPALCFLNWLPGELSYLSAVKYHGDEREAQPLPSQRAYAATMLLGNTKIVRGLARTSEGLTTIPLQ